MGRTLQIFGLLTLAASIVIGFLFFIPLCIGGSIVSFLIILTGTIVHNNESNQVRHQEMLAAMRGKQEAQSPQSLPYNPYYQRPKQSKTDISKLGSFEPPSE